MFCKTCWANIPDGTKVCPRCGKDPAAPPEPVEDDSKQKKGPVIRRPGRKVKKAQTSTLSWAVTMLVLLLVGGGIYYRHATTKQPSRVRSSEPAISGMIEALREAEGVKSVGGAEQSINEMDAPEIEIVVVQDQSTSASARKGVDAMNSGNYLKASVLFEQALDESPDNRSYMTNYASSLAAMGREEFKARKYRRSAEFYSEALEFDSDSSYLKGLAFAQARGEELESAAETLEEIVDEGSGDPDVTSLLKVVYTKLAQRAYSGGDFDESISYYEKALFLDPADRRLVAKLDKLKREDSFESDFRQKEGGHFTVRFEGGENAVTGYVISLLLEEAYIKLGADLGYRPADGDKVMAVLYSAESFRDVTRSPSWVGALYDGRIKIPVGGVTESTRELEKVIFHEYTHALVHRISGGRAPVWLNEGLAQYLEGKRTKEYEKYLKEVFSKEGGKVDLRRYQGSFMGLSTEEAYVAYAVSLSATEYLIREYSLYTARKVLEKMKAGKTLDRALFSVIYLSYEQFEEGWRKSVKRRLSIR